MQERPGAAAAGAGGAAAAALRVGHAVVRVAGSGRPRELALARPGRLHRERQDLPGRGQAVRRHHDLRGRAAGTSNAGPSAWAGPSRRRPPAAKICPRDQWIDLQDATFNLYQRRHRSSLEQDELASDKTAARMPGSTIEWAVQQSLLGKPLQPDATYSVYAAIRVEKTGNEGPAFTAGIYDTKNRMSLGQIEVSAASIADDQYHVYRLVSRSCTRMCISGLCRARTPTMSGTFG